MATHKGKALAVTLHMMGGGKSWDTEGLCSYIARNAATYTRLQEEACPGPRWSWNYRGDWTEVISVADFEAKNEKAIASCERRLVLAVGEFPPTEFGSVKVALGGDPRGYTVRLLVPTSADEVTEVCIDGAGHQIGLRQKVEA